MRERPIHQITPAALDAFMSSSVGKNAFVKRMAETIRQQWMALNPPPVSTLDSSASAATEQDDYALGERVLVVSDVSGVVEVFAEPWVQVKHVEIKPWEDLDEVCESLPEKWKDLDYPVKSRALIVPRVRATLDEKVFDQMVLWTRRAEAFRSLAQWKVNRDEKRT